jgi:hypothetical protein
MAPSRFRPPWSIDELEACFVVRDHNGQALAYIYYENEPGGVCVQLAAQTMSVPILTVTLSAKLELHWSTKL